MNVKISSKDIGSDFREEVERRSGVKMSECYQCGKCSAGCPACYDMYYTPNQIMRLIQLGARDEVLSSRTIWICASCITCTTRCPKEVDIARVIDTCRQMAVEEGKVNPNEEDIVVFHRVFLNEIKDHGRLHEVGLVQNFKMRRPGRAFDDITLAPAMKFKGKLPMKWGFLPFADSHTNISKDGRKAIKRIFQECGID